MNGEGFSIMVDIRLGGFSKGVKKRGERENKARK